ncbi:MAG: hypothetical protein EZS28_012076 [Streblomastix strix]|uniref:Uncharacterized protein n=1 Tax=Streblomastix strix TaxID=222440 RepID=A0A5J4WC52_9EUKA|nr:MAG: hypothetical protein EZS28_012076 [Streblomastix strix]
MSSKESESLRDIGRIDFSGSKSKTIEIPLLVNEFLSSNPDQQTQATQHIISIILNDESYPSVSIDLFLSALVCLIKGSVESSQIASDSLGRIIKQSTKLRESLIKTGFVEFARLSLIDSHVGAYVQMNILEIINQMLFNGVEPFEMRSLLKILNHKAIEKDSQKKEIAQKSKMILAILASSGVTLQQNIDGTSNTSEENEDLKMKIEELKREIEIYEVNKEDDKRELEFFKTQNTDFHRRDIEQTTKISEQNNQIKQLEEIHVNFEKEYQSVIEQLELMKHIERERMNKEAEQIRLREEE